ncbi:sensor protein KdpD [Flavobacterium selenitireducens]|uniref:sensor protein KdpD n=1 Tax=Flavobacterium selenitireducens TaxID=2722704 RepID=UPI00168AE386|nr:sensor protein KdpD [Flavobacterium selenitireducens]MBD3581200.1 sensor protein KdpD [Flavobacterium selenitireducens]
MSKAQHFLELIQKSRRGKFKVYIGMAAGVGKTFRMLTEAHSLLKSGIDVKIGYVETHEREETKALLHGLVVIPRRRIFYMGKDLDEMDVQAILNLRPEVVIVDELAHSNIRASKNEKRWQDVLEILESGINVISAFNIQHLESLHADVRHITGVDVRERIPDLVLRLADEVVNIDLTSDELIQRLRDGKVYAPDKVASALTNFFKPDHILQLRELALKEVASQVVRKVESELPQNAGILHERLLACISSNEKTAKMVIRKTARLANYYNSAQWFVLYVQTSVENPDRIALDKQRHLINNFKLAVELGAEVIRIERRNVADGILEVASDRKITTVCIGKPHFRLFKVILSTTIFNRLLNRLSRSNVDLVILS